MANTRDPQLAQFKADILSQINRIYFCFELAFNIILPEDRILDPNLDLSLDAEPVQPVPLEKLNELPKGTADLLKRLGEILSQINKLCDEIVNNKITEMSVLDLLLQKLKQLEDDLRPCINYLMRGKQASAAKSIEKLRNFSPHEMSTPPGPSPQATHDIKASPMLKKQEREINLREKLRLPALPPGPSPQATGVIKALPRLKKHERVMNLRETSKLPALKPLPGAQAKKVSPAFKRKKAFRYDVTTDSKLNPEEATKKRQIAIAHVKLSNIPERFKSQLCERILDPSCMDQERNSLCGPTAMLMQLAELDPIKYAEIAIRLIADKKYVLENKEADARLKLKNKYDEKQMEDRTIDMIMCSAFRRATNRTSAYASNKSAPSLIEKILGYSSPDDFTLWFQALFGNCDITNTARVLVKGGEPAPEWIQEFTGVFDKTEYSDMNANLDLAIDHLNRGYSASMFMTMGLTYLIIAYNDEPNETHVYDKKDDHYAPIIDIEFAHFVKVKALSKETDKVDGKIYVNIVIDTWTEEYKARVPYDEFMKGYRGCMMVNPSIRLTPSALAETSEDSEEKKEKKPTEKAEADDTSQPPRSPFLKQ